MVHDNCPAGAVIRQRRQLVMKQRQPVFHPRMHPSRSDRIIQRVAACQRPEGGPVSGPEAFDRSLVKLEFGDRPQHKPVMRLAPSLRCRFTSLRWMVEVVEKVQL